MSIAALSLLLVAVQDKPMATYTQPDTFFQFEYPKAWTMKKTRLGAEFKIPIPDTELQATLTVLSIENTNVKEEWQIGQANFVKQDRREMVRQWEEEIMNVPLLMTRSKKAIEGQPEITWDTGMIYSDWVDKFVFHLSAPTSVFDTAEFQWRQVLETLKTTKGIKLSPFDPNAPLKGAGRIKISVWSRPAKEAPKNPVIGEQSLVAKAAGKDFTLRYPKGWTAVAKEDHFAFTHPNVAGEVEVSVLSATDSPPVGRALVQASAISLEKFTKVVSRHEAPVEYSRSGMLATYIWRVGEAASGRIATFDAAGSIGNEYWLFQWSGDAKDGRSIDRLRDLMNVLRIEAVL